MITILLSKLPTIALLLIGAICVAVGDYFAKSWSVEQRDILYYIAFASYALSPLFYLPTLLKESLIVTTIIWSILIILVSITLGAIVFHETLSPLKWSGVILGLVALVILSLAE
ncbi:MAG: hypothetical protein AAB691_02355 [Patescibacteria group bacterium]